MDFVSYGWEQTSEVADWPLWLIFIAWPVAGMVWAVFGVESLFGASRHGHGSAES
jgi:TRAP-type C4-dicarboxylate transport system permease small subunit